MLDEFFCLNCRKYKPLLLKSTTKIGRYKKAQVCTACNERAKKRLISSKKDPEQLIGFSTLKEKHRAKALENNIKKSYTTDSFYNYMKNSNLL